MADILKWGDITTWTSVMTTEFDSIADEAGTSASSEISNDAAAELDRYAYLNLDLGSYTPTSGGFWSFYFIPKNQSGNYGVTAPPMAHTWVCDIQVEAAATAKDETYGPVLIPPVDFKIVAYNYSGATSASSGNTLYLLRANIDLNG